MKKLLILLLLLTGCASSPQHTVWVGHQIEHGGFSMLDPVDKEYVYSVLLEVHLVPDSSYFPEGFRDPKWWGVCDGHKVWVLGKVQDGLFIAPWGNLGHEVNHVLHNFFPNQVYNPDRWKEK